MKISESPLMAAAFVLFCCANVFAIVGQVLSIYGSEAIQSVGITLSAVMFSGAYLSAIVKDRK